MHTYLAFFVPIAAVTTLSWLWLWFMLKSPDKWGAWVDRENAFWVRRGITSASFADKLKRFEKGTGQKILVGAGAVLGSLALIIIAILEVFVIRVAA